MVVNYAGKPAPAQAVVADLKAAGGQGTAVQADVALAADVERLFKESMEAFGRPDVVVHCAGVMPLFPIASGDVAAFDQVIATNLRGTFLVFAQAAQHVPDDGRIMAFSSSALAKSFPTYGAYIASKTGVEGMVHVLANELRVRNITVNASAGSGGNGPVPQGQERRVDAPNSFAVSASRTCSNRENWPRSQKAPAGTRRKTSQKLA